MSAVTNLCIRKKKNGCTSRKKSILFYFHFSFYHPPDKEGWIHVLSSWEYSHHYMQRASREPISKKCVQDGGAASRGIIRIRRKYFLFLNPVVVSDPEVYYWMFSALTTISGTGIWPVSKFRSQILNKKLYFFLWWSPEKFGFVLNV